VQQAREREACGALQFAVLRDQQVFEHGHARKEPDVLEGAHDARLVGDAVALQAGEFLFALRGMEHDGPGTGAVKPCDAVEQRGLACAVGADHRRDAFARHLEREAVDGRDAAKAHHELLHRQ